jgi:hypothetical protein
MNELLVIGEDKFRWASDSVGTIQEAVVELVGEGEDITNIEVCEVKSRGMPVITLKETE